MTTLPLDKRTITSYGITALCAACFLLFSAAMLLLARENPFFVIVSAGAIAGLVAAVIFGTRLGLPLYFATSYGTVLAFPFLPISLNRAFAAFLFLTIVLEVLKRRDRFPASGVLFIWIFFNLYYLLFAWILKPPGAAYPIESIFYLVTTLLIACRFWSQSWMRILMWGMVLTSVLMIVIPGTFELLTGLDVRVSGIRPGLGRIDGLSVNAIMFAFAALFTIPLAATLVLSENSLILRTFLVLVILALIFLSLATLNRQTPIILGTMLVVYVYLMRTNYRSTIAGFLIVGALCTAPVMGIKIVERFATGSVIQRDPSLSVRHDKMLIAREMWKDHLFFGIGHNYFKDKWPEYKVLGDMLIIQYLWDRQQFIDLGYIQIFTDYGLVGSLIVLFLFIVSLLTIKQLYYDSLRLANPFWTNFVAALAALFTQLVVSLLVQDTIALPRAYFMFGMIAAAQTGIALAKSREDLP